MRRWCGALMASPNMPRHRTTFGEGQWSGSCNPTGLVAYSPRTPQLFGPNHSTCRSGSKKRKQTPHKRLHTHSYEHIKFAKRRPRINETQGKITRFLRKERTVFTTQTTVSTRPQPLRRLQWRRLRPLLQTAQKNTNTTGTALKAGEPAYTIPIPTRN